MSRTRRATWTFATFLLFTAVTLVTGMVATPRIVAWLDPGGSGDRFGTYQAALALGGWITLLELGVSGGTMAMLSQALGRGDDREVRRTMASGIRAAGFVCVLMLLMGAALLLAIPHLMNVDPVVLPDLRVGFALYVLACLSFPLQPFRALLDAGQRGYVVNSLIVIQCLLLTAMALAFAWLGWGITGQFLAFLIGTLGLPIALAAMGLRRYPGLIRQAWTEPIPADLARPLWSLNRASMVLNVCGRLSTYTDSLIVAFFLPMRAVKLFYLSQRLAVMAQNQLLGFGNSTWAALAELHLTDKHDLFCRRLGEVNKLIAVLGVAILIPIAAYNREFVGLWISPEEYGGDGVTIAAALLACLTPFTSIWGWMFAGMARTPRLVPTIVLGTILNVAVSVAATRWIGLVGPLLGTLAVSLGFYSWRYPLLLKREFGVPPRLLLRAIGPALLLGIPCAFGAWWFARAHPPRGWLGLACGMGVTSLLYPPLAWALILTREERAVWAGRARPPLGRFLPTLDLAPVEPSGMRSDGGLLEVEGPEASGPAPEPADDLSIRGPAR